VEGDDDFMMTCDVDNSVVDVVVGVV